MTRLGKQGKLIGLYLVDTRRQVMQQELSFLGLHICTPLDMSPLQLILFHQ
jgi:hypothetical protein